MTHLLLRPGGWCSGRWPPRVRPPRHSQNGCGVAEAESGKEAEGQSPSCAAKRFSWHISKNIILFLASIIRPGTPKAESMSETDAATRERLTQMAKVKLKNLHMFVSPTRLAVYFIILGAFIEKEYNIFKDPISGPQHPIFMVRFEIPTAVPIAGGGGGENNRVPNNAREDGQRRPRACDFGPLQGLRFRRRERP